MRIAVFTSITAAYLPNARLLGTSLAENHPDWDFYLLFNDRTPSGVRWENEPFKDVIFAEWLSIGRPWYRFAYGYSIVEFCTATKGTMAQFLLRTLKYDAVVYLDPDVYVFSPLLEVSDVLRIGTAQVILTPHLTDPEENEDADGIWSHEIAALKHGVFNLGFFAISNRALGLRFLDWWENRLLDYSHINFTLGTFTDQKWANIAPYMFEGIQVLCDRSYNVATWNIKGRRIRRNKDLTWTVNGRPLRFYHFSGFGNNFAWAKRELKLFAKEGDQTADLWGYYEALYNPQVSDVHFSTWAWSTDAFGRKIDENMRKTIKRPEVVDPFRTLY